MADESGTGAGVGRTPPQNLDAERSVLGGVIIKPAAFDDVATTLEVDDFYLPPHREIYAAMRAVDKRRQPIDVIALADELKTRGVLARLEGGEAYLVALANGVPTAENVGHYARIVKEKSTLRRLIAACVEIQSRAYGDPGEFEQFLDGAEDIVFQVAQRNRRDAASSTRELMEEVLHNIEVRSSERKTVTGVPTGFKWLDRTTAGLQRENLIIVAARPGGGKTSWAVNVAVNAALGHGIPVMIFSLEMSKYELMERMLAGEARLDSSRIRSGFIEYSDWKTKIHPAASRLAGAPIVIDDSSAPSIMEIRAKARRFRANPAYFPAPAERDGSPADSPLGLVVVDYLQLARGSGGRREDNRQQEIAEISRGLKALAKDLKIPIVATSQLNREVEKREGGEPRLSDLRECVTGDTIVSLADGRRVPIASLVGQTPEVLCVTDEGRIGTARAEKVWCVGSRRVLQLRLASGRSIRCTGRHRLLGASGWIRLSEIAVGGRVAVAHRLPEPATGEAWPDLRVALLGHLIGDGSYLEHGPVRYTTGSDENSAIVAEAAHREFGCAVKRYVGRRSWHQLLVSGNGNRRHPAGVNKWLRGLGIFGQRSHQKRVPEVAFRLSNRQVALLLQHLWATDGTIAIPTNPRHGPSVMYGTNSAGLASDVMALLLRLGIVARTTTARQGTCRPSHMVTVTGVDNQRRFLRLVGAFGPRAAQARNLAKALQGKVGDTNVDTVPIELFDEVRALMRARGVTERETARLRGTSHAGTSHSRFAPSRAVVAQYAAILDDPRPAAHATSELYWDRVVDLEPLGHEEVFDLTVPGPACWLADSVVSHNSGSIEQDADLVLFIHRDEGTTPEGERLGSMAKLILGKHRNGATGPSKMTFIREYTRFENFAEEGEEPY